MTQFSVGVPSSFSADNTFRLVWENAFDGMRLIDQDGIILQVNNAFCRLMEKSREELIGKPFSVIYHQKDQYHVLDSAVSRMKQGQIESQIIREMILWNDNHKWFELSNSFIQEDQWMLLSVFRDITAQKQAEEKLIESEKKLLLLNASKDRFFSILAHDLRGPLTGLIGLSKTLSENLNNLSLNQVQTYSRHFYEAVLRMQSLLENLLRWSSVQIRSILIKPKKIDLYAAGQSVISMLGGLAEEKSIHIENGINQSCYISADKDILQLVLRNLVSNAIKFTPRRGKITLDGECCDDQILIRVSDTGVGMLEHDMENLFRIDHKFSLLGTEGEKGSGLGLVLCQDLLLLCGSRMEVHSCLQEGSVFQFKLPHA